MKYIDVEKLKVRIAQIQKEHPYHPYSENYGSGYDNGYLGCCGELLSLIDSLQQEQPEPYFYCKHGGIMPLCSDCKRNHSNSSFKTEEITTWYVPSRGTKQCIDYIQQEQDSIQDAELTGFESALFTAFSYAWQCYLRGEEVNVVQWAKENSAELLEAARCQQKQPEVELEKEMDKYYGMYRDETGNTYDVEDDEPCFDWKEDELSEHEMRIAHHFYELGLNARKGE